MLKQLKFIVKNTAIYSVGNIATKLAGVILLPLYSKNIPIAMFGLLSLLDMIIDLILSINGVGIGRALSRWYWDKQYASTRKSMVFTAYVFYLFSSLLFLLITFFLLQHFQLQILQIEVKQHILHLFLLSLLFKSVIFMPMQVQRIQQKALINTTLNTVNLVFTIVFTVYFLIFRNMELEGVFLARIIGSAAVLIILIPYILNQIEFRIQWKLLSEMLRFSWPLVLSDLSSMILALSDRFIINIISTLENVGIYSIAFRISNVVKLLVVNAFSQAYVHIFFKSMNAEDRGRLYTKTLTYFVYMTTFFSLAISLFAKEILQVFSLGNENYWQSYPLIPVLILGIIVNGMRRQMVLVMMKERKTRIILLFTIIVALLNILLNFLLIPVMGNYGAALATLISQIVLFTMNYLYILKKFNEKYEIKKTVLILICFLIIYGTSLLLRDLPLLITIPAKIILIVFFPVLLLLFHFYEPIELLRLKQSWKKWCDPKNWKNNISKINFR